VLLEILSDANNGAQVIGKILAISTLPPDMRPTLIETVRRVLPNVRASSTPPYRLLLEAVGLPVPAGTSPFGRQHPQQSQGQNGYYTSPQNAYQRANNHTLSSPQPQYGMMGPNLSPLLMTQNMPLGQGRMLGRVGGVGGSPQPRTPQARQMGRLSPGSQMMSPGSDPFNPVSLPRFGASN
jgi:protein JSN1